MAKKPQKIDSSREPMVVTKSAPPERIVGSTSLLSRMLNVDRATVVRWRNDGMPTHDKRTTKRGDDFSYDLAAVYEWRFQQGIKTERERAVKEKSAATAGKPGARPEADPDDPSGTWVHPRTGKTYTNAEVIAAEKSKIMDDSERAEIQRRKAFTDFQKLDGKVSDNEDILALWAFHTGMLHAALENLKSEYRALFVQRDMHPNEARRLADGPVDEMVAYLKKTDPFVSPFDEEKDDEDEAGREPDEDDVSGERHEDDGSEAETTGAD